MSGEAEGRAEAKINLGLRILGRRSDGYHEISSIFHTITLADSLVVSITEGTGLIELDCCGAEDLPGGPGNLAARAASAFLEASGLRLDVRIRLEKKIPVAAGLGGGSSDAACVLRLLSSLTGVDPGIEALAQLLGSDVPFLVHGGAALVRGRGERVQPLTPGDFWAVVLNPGLKVSTADAYAAWDGRYPSLTIRAPLCDYRLPELAWHEGRPFPVSLCNDFLPQLLERFPAASEIATRLDRACPAWGLSGSGPSFYGLFRTRTEAEAFELSVPGRFSPVMSRASNGIGASSNW